MDDATWAAVVPIWGEAAQSAVSARAVVDALLMRAGTGCPWHAVDRYASPEAARNQLKRRAANERLAAMVEALSGAVPGDVLAGFKAIDKEARRIAARGR